MSNTFHCIYMASSIHIVCLFRAHNHNNNNKIPERKPQSHTNKIKSSRAKSNDTMKTENIEKSAFGVFGHADRDDLYAFPVSIAAHALT